MRLKRGAFTVTAVILLAVCESLETADAKINPPRILLTEYERAEWKDRDRDSTAIKAFHANLLHGCHLHANSNPNIALAAFRRSRGGR